MTAYVQWHCRRRALCFAGLRVDHIRRHSRSLVATTISATAPETARFWGHWAFIYCL